MQTHGEPITEERYLQEVLRTYCAPQALIQDPLHIKLILVNHGLAGETGEVIDALKKVLFQGHALDVPHICEEIGDVLWYITLLADALGLSLDDIRRANIAKMHRRFPEGFSAERSINRNA